MQTYRPRREDESDERLVTSPKLVKARRNATAKSAASRKRRMVDPTTCERDYSADEVEFMKAMQAYKQASGRQFPTWTEILEVLRSLGYRKS